MSLDDNKKQLRILLVGDVHNAFTDADSIVLPINRLWQVSSNMIDAIDIAANKTFDAIVIVMAGITAKLNYALKAMRKVSGDAKIILLAQVYEEPKAAKFTRPDADQFRPADEYIICPIKTAQLRDAIVGTKTERVAEPDQPLHLDIAEQTKIRHLEKLATEDDLTGLKNRRYMWEFARQIIERAGKDGGRVTLLLFDIDDFKRYNDEYSHLAGDEVLKQATVLMKRCCRSHDIVGRIGGDEFAVIFWDDPQRKITATDTERRLTQAEPPKEAIFIAKRFRKELENTELNLLGPKGKGVLTISGGLASYPRDGSTMQELFAQADKALLEAKRSGKNRIYLVGKPESDIEKIE